MDDLKQRLEPLEAYEMPERWDEIMRRVPRGDIDPRRLTSRVGRVAIVAFSLILSATTWAWLLPGDSETTGPPRPSTPASPASPLAPVDLSILPPGWTRMPNAPDVRRNAVKVWTGSGVLVWGGYVYTGSSNEVALSDGYLWDPVSGDIDRLPVSPLAPRADQAGVWTGAEMLVWGGWDGGENGTVYGDGAAYDPASRVWRILPPAPISPRIPTVGVWTGSEFVIWGDQAAVQSGRVDGAGAAYDPAADSWRSIAPPPPGVWDHGVWTGEEIVTIGYTPAGAFLGGATYDPDADTWTRVTVPPVLTWALSATWDGEGVVVADGGFDVVRYAPDTDAWTILDDVPLEPDNYGIELIGGEGFILALRAGETLFLGPDDRWHEITQEPTRFWNTQQVVSADTAMIVLRRNNDTDEERALVFRPLEP